MVSLASDKIVDRCSKTSSSSSGGADFNSLFPTPEPVTRISLPDIPLTPRERKILEETSESAQRKHLNCSVESIDIKNLNVAPPKPPLPSRYVEKVVHTLHRLNRKCKLILAFKEGVSIRAECVPFSKHHLNPLLKYPMVGAFWPKMFL